MKIYVCLSILIAVVVFVESSHTFYGSSTFGVRVYHKDVKFSSKTMLRKRAEDITYTLPASFGYGKSIQGILAYDLTNSGASANVTSGGLGYSYVTISMKNVRGHPLHYDLSIYA